MYLFSADIVISCPNNKNDGTNYQINSVHISIQYGKKPKRSIEQLLTDKNCDCKNGSETVYIQSIPLVRQTTKTLLYDYIAKNYFQVYCVM